MAPVTLLANAISLSTVGVDDTALVAAVGAAQAQLDRNATIVTRARSAAAAARSRAEKAQGQAAAATARLDSMASAIRQAAVFLYVSGPNAPAVGPSAGRLVIYASDYELATSGPYGVLASARATRAVRDVALRSQLIAEAAADKALAHAAAAESSWHRELARLQGELAEAGRASASAIAADHATLAAEAGAELLSADTSLEFTPKIPLPRPVATTSLALTWAFAELGRPYVWGATGPATFDCSGLTQFVWKRAGVSIPRVASDQDAWSVPVPLSQLLPGDLVFFGTTDIHHVGIYIGDGLMINAPHTGDVVRVSSIWWSDLAGFGRVHADGVPIPPHNTPGPSSPTRPAIVPTAGPVPSQTKPPAGWKPGPGSSVPVRSGHSRSTSTPTTKAGSHQTTTTTQVGAPHITPTTVTQPPVPTTKPTVTGQAPTGGVVPPGPDESTSQ